jgi:hypothetical protein
MTAATPSAGATPYLGIENMWRGHVASIDRNVLDVWVKPRPGVEADTTAYGVLDQLQDSLRKSVFQIVIIKIGPGRGESGSSVSFVFDKDREGEWVRLEDPSLLDGIIRAGL